MFTKVLFNGDVQYYATARNNDLYRIVKRNGGYEVFLHQYEAELSAIVKRPVTETAGKLVNEFNLLRDAKEYLRNLLQ